MASEIKYTFFQYVGKLKGTILCACIDKYPIYDYVEGKLIAFSFTTRKKKVAVWKVKKLNKKSLSKSLNNEVQSIAA